MKIIAFNKRESINSFSTQFKVFPTDDGLEECVEKYVRAGYNVHVFTYSESYRLDNNILNFDIETKA